MEIYNIYKQWLVEIFSVKFRDKSFRTIKKHVESKNLDKFE